MRERPISDGGAWGSYSKYLQDLEHEVAYLEYVQAVAGDVCDALPEPDELRLLCNVTPPDAQQKLLMWADAMETALDKWHSRETTVSS